MALRQTIVACAVAGAAGLLSSCGADQPTAPSTAASLRLTGTIGQSIVAPDAPAPLTFQLQNAGTQAITLNFPSSCQIDPYITDAASGRIIYPAGGGWGCAAVVTTLQLLPTAVSLHSLVVTSADSTQPTPGAVSLPPGQYSAYATVTANEIQLRSDAVAFTVR